MGGFACWLTKERPKADASCSSQAVIFDKNARCAIGVRHNANSHLGRVSVVSVLDEFSQRNVHSGDKFFAELTQQGAVHRKLKNLFFCHGYMSSLLEALPVVLAPAAISLT